MKRPYYDTECRLIVRLYPKSLFADRYRLTIARLYVQREIEREVLKLYIKVKYFFRYGRFNQK